MCWCPAPRRALCHKEILYPVFSCPGRGNLPKQGGRAQSIPCLQALRWYCSVGESVRVKPYRRAGPSQGPGLGQQPSSCHPCFIQLWELWAGLALGDGTCTRHRQLSELPCPVTVKQKYTPDRKIKETLIMGQLCDCSSI